MKWHRSAQQAPDPYELMADEFSKSIDSMRLVENKVREDRSDYRSDRTIYLDGYLMYSGRVYLPKALMDQWKCDLKTCITTDWEPDEYFELFVGSEHDINEITTTYELVKADQDGDYWNVLVKINVSGSLYYAGPEDDGDARYDAWVDRNL